MKNIVIKIGGSLLENLGDVFFQNIRQFQQNGYNVVIVHGGGPEIDYYGEKLGIVPKKIDGIRITDEETMKVVSMVLNGLVNKRLVSTLLSHHFPAVGISGVDNHLLQATVSDKKYGYVGEVQQVNVDLLKSLMEEYVVVISPVGISIQNEVLNINGDVAAGAIANALEADLLIMATDVDGILNNGILIEAIDEKQIHTLIETDIITGGMIPKVQSACKALHTGVKKVCITNGLKNFITKNGFIHGTMVSKEGDNFEKFVIS